MRQDQDLHRLRESKRRIEQLLSYYRETVGEEHDSFRIMEERLAFVAATLQTGAGAKSFR